MDTLTLAMWWEQIKHRFLADGKYFDIAHILIGLGVYAVALLLLRKRRGAAWLALIPIVLLQAANETLDLMRYYQWVGLKAWPESVRDSVNTLLSPLALAVFLSRRGKESGLPDETSGNDEAEGNQSV